MSQESLDYLEVLNHIWKEGGCLLRADAIVDKDMPTDPVAIVLSFQHGAITVRAVPEDDTVSVEQGRHVIGGDECAIDLQDTAPWRRAIGKSVLFAWLMTNQQLYVDGVQFEFANTVQDTSATIQLVTVASSLRIFEVHEPSAVTR